MALSREEIALLVKMAVEGEENVEGAFKGIEAAQATLEERAKRLRSEMRNLARSMEDGSVSVADGTEQYNKLQRELDETERGLKDVNNQTKDSGMRFTELASKLSLATAAFDGVKRGAEIAIDAIQRGAEIQAVSDTFDNLTRSIGTTSEVMMFQLRTATQNMVSDFDLMSSANRFMAMGLANTSEEAAELAEVAVTLGSAMGTGPNQAMEDFALLLANQSIPRLDTFGISSGRVRERVNELTAGVNGLDRETAFLQATMEEAEKTMVAVGGAMDGAAKDAATLEADFANVKDGAASLASTIAGPLVGALSAEIQLNKAAKAAVDAEIVSRREVDEILRKHADRLNTSTGSTRVLRAATEELTEIMAAEVQALADINEATESYDRNLTNAGQSQIDLTDAVEETNEALEVSNDLANRYAEAGQEVSEQGLRIANRFHEQAAAAQAAADAQQGLISTSQEAAGIIEEGYGAAAQAAEDSKERQLAADAELKEQLIASVLEIAEARILAQGGDALGNLEEFLGLQEAMGTLTAEEAEKRLEQAENTLQAAEVTQQLMDVYLNDGVLASEEADRLATVTSLIGDNAELTTEQLVTLGTQGTEHAEMITSSFETTNEQFETANTKILNLADALAQLPEERTITITIDTVGSIPSGVGGTSHVMEEAGAN